MSDFPLLIDRVAPQTLGKTLAAVFIGAGLLIASSHIALSAPNWTPQSSERLVKLPPSYLQKSIDHDFSKSELASAIQQQDENIGLKGATLGDLQKALETANGDVRFELRHQFLAEKRAYLDMMSERNDLKRHQLTIKRRLFDDMLAKLAAENGAMSPEKAEVIEQQDAALARFESSMNTVDQRLFEMSDLEESKYSKSYTKNMEAIEKLVANIEKHKMNQTTVSENGVILNHEDQIRRMAADVQTELAILEQEETMLGYMAKLVALDAMSLSEEGMDAELVDSNVTLSDQSPADNVSFFLTN